MNNGIKASLAIAFLALGGAFLFTALRPVHAPVAKAEPVVVALPEQVITPSIVVTEGPGEYHAVAAKAHRGANRKTAKLDMMHVVGLKGETVDQIKAPKHERMTFDVDVSL